MIFRNSEHYYDPTAGAAIANVMREGRPLRDQKALEKVERILAGETE